MTLVKRLRLLTTALGLAAVTAVVGSAVFSNLRAARTAATPARGAAGKAAPAETVITKFTNQPTLTYKSASGDTIFAWQVKPTLEAPRPRDILVMVDTSASQAGAAMNDARSILAALATGAGQDDRIDVWTININDVSATRSLSGGFHPPTSEPIKAAQTKLAESEYGSGAVDLKAGLEKAAAQFPGGARQQILLYLGDGESAASAKALTETTRVELGNRLADRDIAFFAVPLGMKIEAQNLHGLATLTGGTVVRQTSDPQSVFVAQLTAAFDAPVLRPDKATFGPEGAEIYPTRLPPLRADRATLVVGKLKGLPQTVSARIEGRVAGVRVTVDLSERLPTADADHYFLSAILDQWRAAPVKDAPALLAADRTLVMASEQFRMFRDEFNIHAVWAIGADRLDHAEKYFQAAAKIDPQSTEAKAGMRIVTRIRAGELGADKVKIGLTKGQKLERLQDDEKKDAPAPGAKQPPPAPQAPAAGAAPPGAPVPAERDLIAQAKAAQSVLEGEYRLLVDDTLRRTRRLLATDPDSAYEDLKRQRDSVRQNDQLSEAVRQRLAQDLETAMREVQLKGAEIKRQLASQRERVAAARLRINEFDQQETLDKQTEQRIGAFKQLMIQARYELAQQEAELMRQERVSRGLPIPAEIHASYRIGQSATNLRELTELRRLREDRFLLTMMQVEKSFIPYPDEPPVHFPPAGVWRELTGSRAERYSTSSLGYNVAPAFRRMKSLLEGEVDRRVNLKDIANRTLYDVLKELEGQFQDYGLQFIFRNDLFPADFKPGDEKIKTTSNLSGLPLGAFLDTLLRDQNMSWIARPEFIEIGPNSTTYSLRYDDKVTRVFDVAELVIGIPQSVNPQTLRQNLQFIGQQATIFGSSFNTFAGAGIGGVGGGGFGGQIQGGFGGGGFGGGGFGGGGIGGGGFGGQQGGFGGQQQGGFQGGQFQGGFQAQGGGGFAGQGGFQGGGLTGQFGIQGNDQSRFLITLVTSVVARGEWDLRQIGGVQQQIFSQTQVEDEQGGEITQKQLNSLGFYPPSRALIIRGSSRYHTTPSFKLRRNEQMGAGGPGLERQGQFAGKMNAAKENVAALLKKTGTDPQKVWNEAIGGPLTDPQYIVAAVDALFEAKEYAHATEAIKATLRKSRVNDWWVHDALAIALRAGQAAPAEVERAALSAVDLDPEDPTTFLKAARAESDLGHQAQAVAYCQRAAALEPNNPAVYANALAYTEKASDVRADVVHWATANLLQRDWADDTVDYHAQAKKRVTAIAKTFAAAGRKDEADDLTRVVTGEKVRDLVVELLFQGQADLDLIVAEPTGAVCSATHRRTTSGGVLKSDILEQTDDNRSELYTAAQAFPGAYTVSVVKALGRPLGNRATVKVTRHQGTDRETVEIFSVDLAAPKPIVIQLDTGGRTELATIPAEEYKPARIDTTLEPVAVGKPKTMLAGAGAGAEDVGGLPVARQTAVPLVSEVRENRALGSAPGMPGLRVEARVSADRKNVVMAAKPVFTGPAKDMPMPTFGLIPGGTN
ncbi:hypothetical protein [Fimbriiglobus ruber]|uniref:Glycine-rich cell wall structural protein n=1 Tax=Fimbriiglobus ruber TaxID=1908690 RepID=A0A225E743_9BACT|nr:hypothetical protein [Fimbriiglobus ruber]OWK44485.1 Glycine-rich cell wall structural protein precursor [Fimbriiglobus ruber]